MAAFKPDELKNRLEGRGGPPPLVVDVRDARAFAAGTIPGAVHLSYDEGVAARLARRIDRRRPVVLVCGWGHKAAIGCIALKREGFREYGYLDGGMEAWGLAGLPTVPGRRGIDELPSDSPERVRQAAGDDLALP